MSWTLRLADRRVFLLEDRLERESRPIAEADEQQFLAWAERYERAGQGGAAMHIGLRRRQPRDVCGRTPL